MVMSAVNYSFLVRFDSFVEYVLVRCNIRKSFVNVSWYIL